MKFMDAGPRRLAGIDCFVSRSGYTGEDGFEISVPAEAAEEFADGIAGERRCIADRAWGARQPAAGGRALPLRPRSRPHDDAGRGRAGMVHSKEPPQGRRAARRISRRGRDPGPARARRAAPPGRPQARRPRAGARRRIVIRRRDVIPADRHRHLRRFRGEPQRAGRDGISAVVATPPPAPSYLPKCAASDWRCGSHRCPSFPTPINAEGFS